MKPKKKIFTLLLMAPLLLTSCVNNEKKITSVYNYDIEVIDKIPTSESISVYYVDVNSTQVLNLLDSGNEFIFFMYDKGCSHCQAAMPIIEEYLRDEGCNHVIYRFEYSDEGYGNLLRKYPEIFPNEVHYPRMFTAKDGEVSYEIRDSRLEYKSTLKSSLKQCTEFTNLYYLSTIEAYTQFQEEFGPIDPYIYDTTDLDSCKEYREKFNEVKYSDEITLFVDRSTATDELKAELGIETEVSEDTSSIEDENE